MTSFSIFRQDGKIQEKFKLSLNTFENIIETLWKMEHLQIHDILKTSKALLWSIKQEVITIFFLNLYQCDIGAMINDCFISDQYPVALTVLYRGHLRANINDARVNL